MYKTMLAGIWWLWSGVCVYEVKNTTTKRWGEGGWCTFGSGRTALLVWMESADRAAPRGIENNGVRERERRREEEDEDIISGQFCDVIGQLLPGPTFTGSIEIYKRLLENKLFSFPTQSCRDRSSKMIFWLFIFQISEYICSLRRLFYFTHTIYIKHTR